ncbi:hypothetical protein [Spiroplasma endosymbiont of Othius punctulatus]|uniref:MurR/RpiR family transcriptional regulator n=1 Tax=Spiroplasma endosymbiont of Othius punctulatus TaxID=3066289 RepID=UPI0030CD67A9
MQNEKYILKMKEIVGNETGTINHSIYMAIINNENKIKDLTLLEFSKLCNTSKPSIIKFLNKSGLSGFAELKYLIKNHSITKQVKNEELVISKEFDSLNSFQKKYLEISINYIKLLEQNLISNMTKINELVSKIKESKTIYIFAQNLAYYASRNFLQKMRMSKKEIILENDLNLIEGYSSQLEQGCLVIIISLSGMNPIMLSTSEKIKNKDVYLFGILGIEGAISQNVDNYFLVPQIEDELWDSYSMRQSYIIKFFDVLYFQIIEGKL